MERDRRVYLVTRGVYSDERPARVYPTLERAKEQFPGATWREFDDMWYAEDVIVGQWSHGPMRDGVTIYELSFDEDVEPWDNRR